VADAAVAQDAGPVDTTLPTICGDWRVDQPAENCDFGSSNVGPCTAINPGLEGLAFCYECKYLDITGCSGTREDAGSSDSATAAFCGNYMREGLEACDWGGGGDSFTTRPCTELGLGFSSGTAYCYDCMSLDTHLCMGGGGDAGVETDAGACALGMDCYSGPDCSPCGLVCSDGTCVPSSCLPDVFEDNDGYLQASYADGPLNNLTLCLSEGSDSDWFETYSGSTYAVDGAVLTAQLSFLPRYTQPTVRLYYLSTSPMLVPWTTSGSTGPGSATYEYQVGTTGTYYVEVTANGSGINHWYNLDLAVGSGGRTCVDDGFEENDDSLNATSLDPGTYYDLVACGADPDFYGPFFLDVAMSYTFGAQVDFTHVLGNIDLYLLYSPDGSSLYPVATSETTNNSEVINHVVAATGNYYLVVGNIETGTSPYNLWFDYWIP
jgi:hypothetical protein